MPDSPLTEGNNGALQRHLLKYGEVDLSARVVHLTDHEMQTIFELGLRLAFSDADGKMDLGLAMAAVRVMEGATLPLRSLHAKSESTWPEADH